MGRDGMGECTRRTTSGAQWSIWVSQPAKVGRASLSRRVHVLKSADLATCTVRLLPFVPKAYQVPSSAWTKPGSGKSVSRASQGPVARISMGEVITDVISVRPRAQRDGRWVHIMLSQLGWLFGKETCSSKCYCKESAGSVGVRGVAVIYRCDERY